MRYNKIIKMNDKIVLLRFLVLQILHVYVYVTLFLNNVIKIYNVILSPLQDKIIRFHFLDFASNIRKLF